MSEYDNEVEYKPGKFMFVAEKLFRNFMNTTSENLPSEEYSIASIHDYIALLEEQFREINVAQSRRRCNSLIRTPGTSRGDVEADFIVHVTT